MKKSLLFYGFLSIILLFTIQLSAQVAINTDGSLPDSSAGLDVKFSNKGFLPPRVELFATNVATPVVSPALGLLVYNTASRGNPPFNVDQGYYYWNGTMWTSLVLPAGLTGETLRNENGQWVANSVLFNAGTNIGIGTSLTTHKLTIEGTNQTLRLIGPGVYGSNSQLNFGDGNYVSLSEDVDDKLLIHAQGRTAITGGNVGIGTTEPDNTLTVAGIIHTSSGGIKFPDNTFQTTAAVTSTEHYIGESFGGGKVFFVYDGGRHGLIAATTDQATDSYWYNGTYRYTGSKGDGLGAGAMNTTLIIATQINDNPTADFAAKICADYSVTIDGITYGDWYLPSAYELNLLCQQKGAVGGFSIYNYWSSTETDDHYVNVQDFGTCASHFFQKYYWSYMHIRAIRAF